MIPEFNSRQKIYYTKSDLLALRKGASLGA